jgi:formamidopyrimidine-DNA glycosylase
MKIMGGRYLKHGEPEGYSAFRSASENLKISKVSCKGKFIWFSFANLDGLESNWSIWNTLGMTGSWSAKKTEHSRVMFHLTESSGLESTIYFSDIRNFGTLKFSNNSQDLREKLNSLGFDILKDSISPGAFQNLLVKNGKKTLPEFLMSQGHLCGVGNYIKSEALYLSGISPNRLCNSLSQVESERLLNSVIKIAKESYKSGGSTIKTYQDFYGNSGEFSSNFLVYGNDVDPLGNKIVRVTTKDKRTTFWVPSLQN